MYKHNWDYCGLCKAPFVRCGKCGNNCCNGTERCTECYMAYKKQKNEVPPDFSEEYKNKKISEYKRGMKKLFGD